MQIDPGETGKYPRVSSHLWITNSNLSFSRIQSMPSLATGRMNAIRLGSSGAFDVPPDSTNMISGAYTLLGMLA
jgi:hypothetical protein